MKAIESEKELCCFCGINDTASPLMDVCLACAEEASKLNLSGMTFKEQQEANSNPRTAV